MKIKQLGRSRTILSDPQAHVESNSREGYIAPHWGRFNHGVVKLDFLRPKSLKSQAKRSFPWRT